MAKRIHSAKKTLERLRSNEPAATLADDLGVREPEVLLARELVRHIGEHQATAAGRLPDVLAQAVVEAAIQIEHADFLKAVAEGGAKSAASAAKRGLAILRSRGIEVELAPSGEAVFKADSATEDLPCFVSTADPAGDRILWIPRPHRGGGLQLVSVLLSEEKGIVHVDADEVSRKGFRRLRTDLARQAGPHGITLNEIPLPRAKGLLAKARALTRGLAIEDEANLIHLTDGDPRDARPPERDRPAPDAETEARNLADSAQLHETREVVAWIPDEEALQAFDLRLDEVRTSSLYVDEAQRHEQELRETERAVSNFFDERRRAVWAERLFELAEAFRTTTRPDQADQAAAVARALESGRDASTIPFCRRLFEKVAETLPAQEGDLELERKNGLILPSAPRG